MSGYTIGWVVWGLLFAVLETAALRQSYVARKTGATDYRGTLSEHLWWLFGINTAGRGVKRDVGLGAKLRRVVGLAFTAWLVFHVWTGGQYV